MAGRQAANHMNAISMKRTVIGLLVVCLSGCAYFHDRGRDACDMVTVAVEAPTINAAVQLGPILSAGLGGAGGKGFGLRSGAMGVYDTEEANLVIVGRKAFAPRAADQLRDKGYDFAYFWIPGSHVQPDWDIQEGKWFNALQFEAVCGVVVGVRVGVNLAEILDFAVGWTTVDICGDDEAAIEKREEREFKKRKASDDKASGGAVR